MQIRSGLPESATQPGAASGALTSTPTTQNAKNTVVASVSFLSRRIAVIEAPPAIAEITPATAPRSGTSGFSTEPVEKATTTAPEVATTSPSRFIGVEVSPRNHAANAAA